MTGKYDEIGALYRDGTNWPIEFDTLIIHSERASVRFTIQDMAWVLESRCGEEGGVGACGGRPLTIHCGNHGARGG
jgi:hypothetical protein